MLRLLVLLELNFIHGDKYGSIGILLYAAAQFDHQHLLKMVLLFQCVFLNFLSRIR